MENSVSAGPLFGRPFGGTAVLVKKSLLHCMTPVVSKERFTVVAIGNWLLASVYLPCAGTADRQSLYDDVLLELDSVISDYNELDLLVGGDFNVDLDTNNSYSASVSNFMMRNNLKRCDKIYPTGIKHTYVNEALQCSSAIDFIMTSNDQSTVAFNIVDIDINLSDHLPLLAVLITNETVTNICSNSFNQAPQRFFRWDHAPLWSYYEHTRALLEPVLTEVQRLENVVEFAYGHNVLDYDAIDKVYRQVVDCLVEGANMFIPQRSQIFFKFWWSQELTLLREHAIESARAWKDSGRPRNGPIFLKYKQCKLLYKRRIKEEQARENVEFSNDLHDALLQKSGKEFWKCWKSKFPNKNSNILLIDGVTDCNTIVDLFAQHFERVCMPFNPNRCDDLKESYGEIRKDYVGSPLAENFDIALIDELLRNMKKGRAAGIDDLSAEHLQYAHPIVIVILCKLFNLFLLTGHVPPDFGKTKTQGVTFVGHSV